MLFVSEFRQYRLIETIDQLDVDVSSAALSKIAINLDLTLPSLPCGEFVVDVVDSSGVQQLDVADKLVKLRLDRHGVPQDIPIVIDWGHTLAPAFKHRKLMSVLETLSTDLRATMAQINEDEAAEGHDAQTHEQHHARRRQLAHRAVLLQEKLAQASTAAEPTAELADVLHASQADLSEIKVRASSVVPGARRAAPRAAPRARSTCLCRLNGRARRWPWSRRRLWVVALAVANLNVGRWLESGQGRHAQPARPPVRTPNPPLTRV